MSLLRLCVLTITVVREHELNVLKLRPPGECIGHRGCTFNRASWVPARHAPSAASALS